MNWGGKLKSSFVVAVLVTTTAPAVAKDTDFAAKTVAACQSTTDLEKLSNVLSQIGWFASAAKDLDDRAVGSYAAAFLYNHLGFGDVPDPRILRTWEQSLKNAAGVRNRKPVKGGHGQDRWFVRKQTGSVLRVTSSDFETYGQISCVFALKEEDAPITFAQLLGESGRDPQTLPPLYHFRPQLSETEDLRRSLNGAVLNMDRISAVSESEIDVSSVYSTTVSTRAENSE